MVSIFKKHKRTWFFILAIIILTILAESIPYDPLRMAPNIPLENWAEVLIDTLNNNLGWLFDIISTVINALLYPIQVFLTDLSPLAIIVFFAGAGYLFGGLRTAIFIPLALIFMSTIGLFNETMQTLSLALAATLLALIVGIPLGIAKAHTRALEVILDPVLDFMQTMPLFVYLIPAVLFFGIGNVPGIIATFIFATPPAVRLTSLGIQQIPKELAEAGHAYGTTPLQFLQKIELPLAMPSIMAGVNQTIMLSLSMVVVASMIGAEGLGQEVLRGITRLNVGQGIASGIGIVLLAMILDRLTKKFGGTPFKIKK